MKESVTDNCSYGVQKSLVIDNVSSETSNIDDDIKYERKKIRYLILLIFVVMFTVTGGTYAYLAFTASNNTMTATTASASLDLKVERILPSTVSVMVPQLEQYLGSAISTTYSCIDDNGNTACQVYKATVTNKSTATVEVNGTIKFSGISNMPNLKWKRITDERTLGEYTSNVASTRATIFEENRVFTKDESAIYYFVVWINEIEGLQTDSGTFRVTIEFKPSNGEGLSSTVVNINDYASRYMVTGATNDASLVFSQTSKSSNTNGVYIRNGTENDKYPIYYYRGNVKNNVIFANVCWKVVRTTETGGLKLLYNGLPLSGGSCANSGSNSRIGNSEFNASSISPAYVGYKYYAKYDYISREMAASTTNIRYGRDVTYSNGVYSLATATTSKSDWASIYSSGLNGYHYTCFASSASCSKVYYIFYTSSSRAYYIALTGGKKIEDALVEMFGTDDNSTLEHNRTSSQIFDFLNSWYNAYIEQKGYSSYVEDTVWCNDRSISSLGGWKPNGGSMKNNLYFSAYERTWEDATPSLSCSRNIDKFTTKEENGNGYLSYPVGLLTADEIMLAGADGNYTANNSYYLYSGEDYWAGSPVGFHGGIVALETFVASDGSLSDGYTTDEFGVRPSISLKTGFIMTGEGDGSAATPYKINY